MCCRAAGDRAGCLSLCCPTHQSSMGASPWPRTMVFHQYRHAERTPTCMGGKHLPLPCPAVQPAQTRCCHGHIIVAWAWSRPCPQPSRGAEAERDWCCFLPSALELGQETALVRGCSGRLNPCEHLLQPPTHVASERRLHPIPLLQTNACRGHGASQPTQPNHTTSFRKSHLRLSLSTQPMLQVPGQSHAGHPKRPWNLCQEWDLLCHSPPTHPGAWQLQGLHTCPHP